jgi:quinol monooxygenase YgiN
MTVLINGYVDFAPGDESQALAEAAALMAETRDQRGCRAYVWSADPTTPGRVYVYENWESVADLAAHLSGRFYAEMLALLGKYRVLDTSIMKYRIDHAEPVYDPEGRPRADFFSG